MNSGWLPVGAAAAASALLLFGAPAGSPGGMLLAVLATLPLFLVGLSWGVFHGAATGAAATFAILFSVGTSAGLYYGVVNALPAALLMWQAERAPDRPDRLVIMLTACAAAPIVAAALYFGTQEGGLEAAFFGGLSVMHWALRRSAAPGLWLGLLYLLLLVFGWPALILLLIGLVDTIFDFRGRAGPPPAAPTV